ncbi:helix-turn-helix transcriptional regulator [Runella sp.]|uniref:helix-turn-helix transcriptional regulator n=1 Tax=Runella sp. TaxID=1960881 RepID=UPI003D0C22CC
MVHLSEETRNTIDSIKYDDNLLVVSSLKGFYYPVKSQGFAIKYVMDGVERYTLNGCQFPVGAGKYLLSNGVSEGHVEIEENQYVTGICVNIVPELLAEVVASQCRPDTAFMDASLGQFFSTGLFLEQQYDAASTHLGAILRRLHNAVLRNEVSREVVNKEFFYTLSEQIIVDQIPVFRQLQAIPSIKPITKKDLYKRVSRGKELIDELFCHPLTVEAVAKEACMSEYHFFRLFKSVFGQTPNQYMIQKRLHYAFTLLQKDRTSVSEAAFASGFSDIFAFSKSFKKHFGYSPSKAFKLV